jgi:putative ABC transport system permease protein
MPPKFTGIFHELLEGVLIALRAIIANKLRATLTLVGIVIGVATVIAVVSVINGMNKYVSGKINSLGSSTFIIDRFGLITSEEEFHKAIRRKRLTIDDMKAIKRYCSDCFDVGASSESRGKVKFGSQYLEDVSLIGVTSNYIDVSDVDIAYGRGFTDSDDDHRRAICILGPDVVENLFNGQDPIDKVVKVGNMYLRVVGVGTKQGSFLGQNQDMYPC